MQKRQFTPEFKREAVRLFRESDKPTPKKGSECINRSIQIYPTKKS